MYGGIFNALINKTIHSIDTDYQTELIDLYIGHIIIPVLSSLSAVINLAVILVIYILKLRKKTYSLIIFRSLCKMLVNIASIRIEDALCEYCISFTKNTLITHIYRIYILRHCVKITTYMTVFLEMSICYTRLLIINKKKNWFEKISATYLVLILFIVSSIIEFPDFFIFQIQNIKNSSVLYERSYTSYGRSIYYQVYNLICSVFYGFVVNAIYLSWIILTCKSYKEFISRKRLANSQVISSNKTRLTQMVILTGILYMFTTILYFISILLIRLDNFFLTFYNPITILFNRFTICIILIIFIINSLLFFFYDKNVTFKNLTGKVFS